MTNGIRRSGTPRVTILLALLAFWLAATNAVAATYFVDFQGGADQSNGLGTADAWKHCPGDLGATGVAGATVLGPGDIVIFKAQTVYQGTITVSNSGAEGEPLSFLGEGWGVGKAVFDGNGTTIGAFDVDADWVSIGGFEITGMAQFGIRVEDTNHGTGVTISRNRIRQIGPYPEASDNSAIGIGIYVRYASRVIIDSNEVSEVASHAIRIAACTDVTIRNNHLHDGMNDGIVGDASGLWLNEYNTIHDFASLETHGDGMQILRFDTLIIRGNTLWNCTQHLFVEPYSNPVGMAPGGAAYVLNNVIENVSPGADGTEGFYNGIVVDTRYNSIESLVVVGNTLVNLNGGNGGLGIPYSDFPIATCVVKNNIFLNSLLFPNFAGIEQYESGTNIFYNAHRDFYLIGFIRLDEFRARYPSYEIGSFEADPVLDPEADAKYYPDGSSPVRDTGAALGDPDGIGFARDRLGVSRPQGDSWDIGAYEYVSGFSQAPSAPRNLRVRQ